MFTYWNVSEDEDSGYYGENGNPANSLHFEITYGNNGLGPSYGYVIRHNGEIVNSVPATTFDDYWVAKDEMNEALPIDSLNDIAPDYNPSIYEKMGERNMKPKTSSMKKASAYEFIDDYTYGDPYEEQNTVTLDIEPDYGGYEATIYAPEYDPSVTPEPLEGGSFTTEDEAIRWFRSTCESSERIKQKLDDNYEPPISSFIASADEDSLEIGFWRSFVGEYFYGVNNDKNKSFRLNIKFGNGEEGSLIYAEITSPYDTVVESRYFTLGTSRSEIEQWFADYCISHLSSDKLLTASSNHVTADEDSLSDDLNDINNNDLTEDDMVPDAIASQHNIHKSDRELVFWDKDLGMDLAFERYGIDSDEEHSLVISVAPAIDGNGMEGDDLGFDAVIQYPAYGFYGTADTVSADTIDEALQLAEDFCLNHAMEYLNFSDITSSVKKSSPVLVPWGLDIDDESAFEYYGVENDEAHSLGISVSANHDTYNIYGYGDTGFSASVWGGACGTVETFSTDTMEEALRLSEDFCRDHAMEYLSFSNFTSSKRTSGRTFRTAKRKWTARERLALINEERIDGDDEFDDLI